VYGRNSKANEICILKYRPPISEGLLHTWREKGERKISFKFRPCQKKKKKIKKKKKKKKRAGGRNQAALRKEIFSFFWHQKNTGQQKPFFFFFFKKLKRQKVCQVQCVQILFFLFFFGLNKRTNMLIESDSKGTYELCKIASL